MEQILQKIADTNNLDVRKIWQLSGGDINSVYAIETPTKTYVAKLNSASKFPKMFEAEAKGLHLLNTTNSFKIPEVIAFGELDTTSYLLIEFIAPGNGTISHNRDFAQRLVVLHQTSNENFGLDHDNYIGSLPQYNNSEYSAADFYINQRLQPQLKMARYRGFKFLNEDTFLKNISKEIPREPPALVHGDLWNGNYMISSENEFVLIDPAIAFAPREMDIGMMQLFGGFPEGLFAQYNELFPMEAGWEERIPLWQLYYLLVHLNLFGTGYLGQVSSIIKRFS